MPFGFFRRKKKKKDEATHIEISDDFWRRDEEVDDFYRQEYERLIAQREEEELKQPYYEENYETVEETSSVMIHREIDPLRQSLDILLGVAVPHTAKAASVRELGVEVPEPELAVKIIDEVKNKVVAYLYVVEDDPDHVYVETHVTRIIRELQSEAEGTEVEMMVKNIPKKLLKVSGTIIDIAYIIQSIGEELGQIWTMRKVKRSLQF